MKTRTCILITQLLFFAALVGCNGVDSLVTSTSEPVAIATPVVELRTFIDTNNSPAPTSFSSQLPLMISEHNDGPVHLGMIKDDLLEILNQYELDIKIDEYGNVNTVGDIRSYYSFNDEGRLHYITASGLTTQNGLAPGDTFDDMARIYGDDYLDIGTGAGEDEYAYNMGEYCFLVDFFNSEKPIVTGWKITNMPDFSWELLCDLYGELPSHEKEPDALKPSSKLSEADSLVIIGTSEFSLGMDKAEISKIVGENGLEVREDSDKVWVASFPSAGSISIYFDYMDRVYRFKLNYKTATLRGYTKDMSYEDMIVLYGDDFISGVYEEKGITTEYRYQNDQITIAISFFEAAPNNAQSVDVYLTSHHPVYDTENYRLIEQP